MKKARSADRISAKEDTIANEDTIDEKADSLESRLLQRAIVSTGYSYEEPLSMGMPSGLIVHPFFS